MPANNQTAGTMTSAEKAFCEQSTREAHAALKAELSKPDFVTDEDLRLREKVRALERALTSMCRVYTSDYRHASESILSILDPVGMSEGEQQACLLLIVFCRRKMAEANAIGEADGVSNEQ